MGQNNVYKLLYRDWTTIVVRMCHKPIIQNNTTKTKKLKIDHQCSGEHSNKLTCQNMKFVLMVWETASFAHVSRLSFTMKKNCHPEIKLNQIIKKIENGALRIKYHMWAEFLCRLYVHHQPLVLHRSSTFCLQSKIKPWSQPYISYMFHYFTIYAHHPP